MNSIVIGSGFGGMAAALRLKAKGHNVTLIEKHKDLGGRARVFKKNGFTFDGGPTVITAPYLIDELFQLFNKNLKRLFRNKRSSKPGINLFLKMVSNLTTQVMKRNGRSN